MTIAREEIEALRLLRAFEKIKDRAKRREKLTWLSPVRAPPNKARTSRRSPAVKLGCFLPRNQISVGQSLLSFASEIDRRDALGISDTEIAGWTPRSSAGRTSARSRELEGCRRITPLFSLTGKQASSRDQCDRALVPVRWQQSWPSLSVC